MKELYAFQKQPIDELRLGYLAGHTRQILAAATGSGKTVMAAHMIHNAAGKGHKSLFIVDRIELVGQAVNHLRSIGLCVGILQGENTYVRDHHEVIVASIQTIRSRNAPPSGFVVIDECHLLHQAHIDLFNHWDAVPVIGLSATPLREDLGKHFTNLVRGPSIQWLMDNKYLTPVRAFCPSEKALNEALSDVKVRAGDFAENELSTALNRRGLIGDIVSTHKERGEDRPTLVFAVDIAHSKAIVDEFQAEGVTAEHLDAYTPTDKRKEIIDSFRAGEAKVLSSVNVLGIGFDVPDASCAILARPTLSEALHIQQMGRVIRTAEGKTDAIILDHSGNTLRFGLPQHFEVPDLGATERKTTKQKRKERKLITCTSCSAVIEPGQSTCPGCGVDREIRKADVTQVDADLIAYGSDATGVIGHSAEDRRQWYKSFLWYAMHHGYSKGWAFHKFQAKFNEKPPWEWQGLKPAPPTSEISRWIKSQNIRWAKSKKKSKAASIKQCRYYGSKSLKTLPGKGPHAAGIGCGSCGQHLGWYSKKSA